MNIPQSESEFIADIKENLNLIKASHTKNTMNVFFTFMSGISLQNAVHVKNRIIHYGVKYPNVPEYNIDRYDSFDSYLKSVWNLNVKSILEARGLSKRDRNIVIGSENWVREWHESQGNSDDWNNGWFTNLPYHERKFIMPVRSFEDYQKSTPDIQRFRISHLPADIKFEDCFPTIGELYIAHPYHKGVYLPVSKYEHLIFRERIHELSKVMMALGATEIRTLQNTDTKRYSSSENSSNTNASGGVGSWGNAKGNYTSQTNRCTESQNEDSIVINFKNDPMDLPKIPEGLTWFPHDKEWQHIAESRIHGNILEYEIKMSSKEVNLVSEMERSNIKAQARILFASGSFSRETSSQSFFKEEAAKTTNILIKFKSRKDY